MYYYRVPVQSQGEGGAELQKDIQDAAERWYAAAEQ